MYHKLSKRGLRFVTDVMWISVYCRRIENMEVVGL